MKYFIYEPRFNDVFSSNNLSRIKYGTYVIDLGDKQRKGTNWVSLIIDKTTAVCFDPFGI